MNNTELIAKARQAAEEEVGYAISDGLLYRELADALEAAESRLATAAADALEEAAEHFQREATGRAHPHPIFGPAHVTTDALYALADEYRAANANAGGVEGEGCNPDHCGCGDQSPRPERTGPGNE